MRKNIIIIDDDTDILAALKYILEDEGYHVNAFTQMEPVQGILSLAPSIVLLDVRLTSGSGDALCKAIKANPASRYIPIILISALPHLPDIARRCKADAFLTKPFDLAHLVAMVKRFAGRKAKVTAK